MMLFRGDEQQADCITSKFLAHRHKAIDVDTNSRTSRERSPSVIVRIK